MADRRTDRKGRSASQGEWKLRMAHWMQGRYGIDELTQALMIVGCACVVVDFFVSSRFLSLLSLVCFAFGLFRVYSRNF